MNFNSSLRCFIAFLPLLWNVGHLVAQDPNPGACTVVGPNLVDNPEFDEGNTSFLSSYSFSQDYPCAFGQYTIANTVNHDPVGGAACYNGTGFNLQTIWAASDRNDPGTGNFMLLDPVDTTGGVDVIWEQTIDVCPGAEYAFSVFAKNLFYLESSFGYSGIDPIFELAVNGVEVPNYYVDGVLAPGGQYGPLSRQSIADSAIWTQISGKWQSGTNATATITIRNIVPGTEGNDVAIDGVFFGLCNRAVDFAPNQNISQCAQQATVQPVTIALTAETAASGWQQYEWYKNGALVQATPAPTNFTTPADANGEYFGTYQLRVFDDPAGSASGACGNVSKAIEIFEDCPVSFPVELMGFDAKIQGERVALQWSTAWESQNRGFEVQMSRVGQAFSSIGFVAGNGTTQEMIDYDFTTEPLSDGIYQFRLRQEDFDGKFQFSGVVEVQFAAAEMMAIKVYPNPATRQATVDIVLPLETAVRAELISSDGRVVASQSWDRELGKKGIQWNLPLENLPAGYYLVRVRGVQQVTQALFVQH